MLDVTASECQCFKYTKMQYLELYAAILFFVFIQIEGQILTWACGHPGPNVNPLMVHAAPANHWPWHAAIFHTKSFLPEYKCGGTVISSVFVLTAGHCVSRYDDSMETNKVLVSLGRFNLGVKNESSAQTFQVDEIFLHPKYRQQGLVNDIAVVRLSTQAEFNNYVQPICLWMNYKIDLSNVVGKYGMVIGWGLTETGDRSDILRQAYMPVVPFHKCLESNRDAFRDYLSDKNFCAGSRNDSSVCFGDSGGSMFFARNGAYFIRGIVSATPTKINRTNKNEECDSNQYALFTDVAKYLLWIRKVTLCTMRIRCVSKLENKLVPVTEYENRFDQFPSSMYTIRKKRQISTAIEAVMTNSDPQTQHWPWHAAIYQLNESAATYRCGGTVISASSILTAGHCVSYYNVPMETEQLSVSLGRLNLSVNERTAQNFNVAEIIMHPRFSSIDLNNDIAILRTSTPATFTNYVQPICLWQSNKKELSYVAGKAGMVIGWGLTEMGVRSDVLRQAFLPVEVDPRKCLSTNRGIFSRYMWESNYCAGSRNGTSVCFGDSGGSMTFVENGVAYIRGIVSLIPGRMSETAVNTIICDSAHYALFTDVAQYLPWIEGAIIESEKNVQCITKSVPFSEQSTEANDIAEDYNHFILGVHSHREAEKISSCGQRLPELTPLMTNSNSTHHWPWHAAIYRKDHNQLFPVYQCAGTVIGSNSIITATHCVSLYSEPMQPNHILVSLGRLHGSGGQYFTVAEVIIHPKFRSSDFSNDIAIIKLSTHATFDHNVQPICLWPLNKKDLPEIDGRAGLVVGWERTETDEISGVLCEAFMPVVSFHTCLESNRDFYGNLFSETNYCAGNRNGTGACLGDIGASMIFEEGGVYFIYGIFSTSPSCHDNQTTMCDQMEYSLFTNIVQYLCWIEIQTLDCEETVRCDSDYLKDDDLNYHAISEYYRYYEHHYDRPDITFVRGAGGKILFCGEPFPNFIPVMTFSHPARYWPWHAAIYHIKDNQRLPVHQCGGTVISSNSILTAAHCVSRYNEPMQPNQILVSLGRLNLDVHESSGQNFTVAEVIIHPDFESSDLSNDIAILRLSTHATFNNYVQPICMWPSNKKDLSEIVGRAGMVVGWGQIETGEISSRVLQQASMTVVDSRKCLAAYHDFAKHVILEKSFCAGLPNGTSDYRGDSGGSMAFEKSGVYYIRGILSLAPAKINDNHQATMCDSMEYLHFTDVVHYLSWIEEVTNPK